MKKRVFVVGCGIVGSVIARQLAEERDMQVTIWERRNHIGGNMYDFMDEHGIRVHLYGPHIFHTNNKNIYDYVCKYGEWEPYKLVCGAVIDGICVPTAFNYKALDLFYPREKANEIKTQIKDRFGNRESATVVELLECEDTIIREWAQFLYDKDYSLYTAKQWGISPDEIDISVLKRVPIRFSYEEAYFADKYQVMPKRGYTQFILNILDHPNIEVALNMDALSRINVTDGKLYLDENEMEDPIIYTGPLDELFRYSDGKLPYRSLRFEWKYEDKKSLQEMPVVAYPQAKDFTRITEYKKLPVQEVFGTTYAVEYPLPYQAGNEQHMEPYYPVLTEESQEMYQVYKEKADNVKNLYYCGRLADFKYYDMDKAIESAFVFLRNTEF